MAFVTDRTDATGGLDTTLLLLLDASGHMRCAASSLVVARVLGSLCLGLRDRVELMPLFGSLRSGATSSRPAALEPQLEPRRPVLEQVPLPQLAQQVQLL